MFQPLAPWCSLHALLAVPLGATEPGPGVGVCVCVCGGGVAVSFRPRRADRGPALLEFWRSSTGVVTVVAG